MMQQTENRIKNDTLTEQIIGSAIQIHRELGPGLLESAYDVCLRHELFIKWSKNMTPLKLLITSQWSH